MYADCQLVVVLIDSPPDMILLLSVPAEMGEGTGYGSMTVTSLYPRRPSSRAVDVPHAPPPTTRIDVSSSVFVTVTFASLDANWVVSAVVMLRYSSGADYQVSKRCIQLPSVAYIPSSSAQLRVDYLFPSRLHLLLLTRDRLTCVE